MKPFFQAKDICFSYDGSKNVLDAFSIELQKGSLTALLGQNGCGKSTFLDTVIGYHHPQTGSIEVDGQSLSDLSVREIARLISYVPQSVLLNIDYSVFDFVLFGRSPYIDPWKKPSKNDYDIALFNAERVGIAPLLEKSITKISGGEKQLACIARSLAQESPVILLDEPTASLDFGNQARLFRILKDLSNEGKTVLFTTHNPNHIVSLGCNVAVMKAGRIVSCGSFEEVLSDSVLSDLYEEEIVRTSDGHFDCRI